MIESRIAIAKRTNHSAMLITDIDTLRDGLIEPGDWFSLNLKAVPNIW